ncbi:MAG: division/cell wall cluster transcriptional repressor MraZ [Pseudomonadota bacterium]
MYFGINLVKLDPKGRVAIPARHREGLRSSGGSRVAVTIHPTGESCLWLFPWSEWEKTSTEVANLPSLNKQYAQLQRLLFMNMFELEVDGQGRILLPQKLRAHAGLEAGEQIAIVGQGRKLEIWSQQMAQQIEEENMQALQDPDSEISAEIQNLNL